MAFFSKLFGGGAKAKTEEKPALPMDCLHAVLVPKWDNVSDMGIESKATQYECNSCHAMFNPEEGREVRSTFAERLRVSELEKAD